MKIEWLKRIELLMKIGKSMATLNKLEVFYRILVKPMKIMK